MVRRVPAAKRPDATRHRDDVGAGKPMAEQARQFGIIFNGHEAAPRASRGWMSAWVTAPVPGPSSST